MEDPNTPQITLFFNGSFEDISPVDAGEHICPPKHFYGPAVRTYWLLHYVLSGKGIFERNGERYRVREGQCFVIRPYETTYYCADSEDPWHYVWVSFHAGIALPTALSEAPVISGQQVSEAFRRIHTLCRKQTSNPDFPVTAALWNMIASFCAEEPPMEPKGGEQYTSLACSYIEREYMTGITVSELAARLHLDRSYFSTVFKRHTGVSPQQYINDTRLKAAAALLLKHDYPVSLVANSTGYTNYCNFSKMFKEKFGVAPKRYAAWVREKEG